MCFWRIMMIKQWCRLFSSQITHFAFLKLLEFQLVTKWLCKAWNHWAFILASHWKVYNQYHLETVKEKIGRNQTWAKDYFAGGFTEWICPEDAEDRSSLWTGRGGHLRYNEKDFLMW